MIGPRHILASVCAVAALTGGCGSTDSSSTTRLTPVTVMLDWTPNTNHEGIYLAKARGLYRAEGLAVRIVEPDQAGAIAQVAAGNAHFGVGAESVIQARIQGTKVRVVATVMRTNTSSLISPADRHITRPRDLVGHTYGGYGSDMERPLISALVRCDGGDPSKVKFVDVGNVDYSVGFKRRQYDSVWVFDGWDTIRLRDLHAQAVTTIAFRDWLRCIPDWYTPNLFSSDALIAKDPELVRRFLRATAAGYLAAAADPAAAADALIDAVPESDPALVRASARFIAPYLTDVRGGWGYQDPAVWEAFNRFLASAKLPSLPTVSDAYTNDLLPAR